MLGKVQRIVLTLEQWPIAININLIRPVICPSYSSLAMTNITNFSRLQLRNRLSNHEVHRRHYHTC